MPSDYVVITPVRNEEKFVDKTITSMIQQTVLPLKWIIVDDGSTDKTPDILDSLCMHYPWIVVLKRRNRGFRHAGTGVIEAFNDGYSQIVNSHWDYLVKLDADLSFAPDYFARCLEYFAHDPSLGIGGGIICLDNNGHVTVECKRDPIFHVRGATKIYRRACWDQISPLLQAPGWDTVDEFKANMYEWTTRSFADIFVIQNRLTGATVGTWRNSYKNGLANYITGYQPFFMIGKCLKRFFQKPYFLMSAGLLAGFCSGYLRKIPRVADHNLIRYVRRQQLRYMLRRPSIYS